MPFHEMIMNLIMEYLNNHIFSAKTERYSNFVHLIIV